MRPNAPLEKTSAFACVLYLCCTSVVPSTYSFVLGWLSEMSIRKRIWKSLMHLMHHMTSYLRHTFVIPSSYLLCTSSYLRRTFVILLLTRHLFCCNNNYFHRSECTLGKTPSPYSARNRSSLKTVSGVVGATLGS